MAIKISGTTVIDDSRNIANITSFDSTVTSIWDTISVTATSKTLVNREHCTVTASGQTITLPATPSTGWEVAVTIAGSFTDTVIGRNGSNIMNLAEDITVDVAEVTVSLIYVDATRGWRII